MTGVQTCALPICFPVTILLEAELNLENPFDIEERVKRAAGEYAGKAARKKQQERIETQKQLADVIALWAGKQRTLGFTDRQIKKKFFITYGMGITEALSQVKVEMLETIELIKGEV